MANFCLTLSRIDYLPRNLHPWRKDTGNLRESVAFSRGVVQQNWTGGVFPLAYSAGINQNEAWPKKGVSNINLWMLLWGELYNIDSREALVH